MSGEQKNLIEILKNDKRIGLKNAIIRVGLISLCHQIFYDETGLEISISIDRAIKKMINLIIKGK